MARNARKSKQLLPNWVLSLKRQKICPSNRTYKTQRPRLSIHWTLERIDLNCSDMGPLTSFSFAKMPLDLEVLNFLFLNLLFLFYKLRIFKKLLYFFLWIRLILFWARLSATSKRGCFGCFECLNLVCHLTSFFSPQFANLKINNSNYRYPSLFNFTNSNI